MKHLGKLFLIMLFVTPIYGQNPKTQKISNSGVIEQMNYCISTLTNIINNKNMLVLQHESDQLVNNLTIEPIVGIQDINDFRESLLEGINKFVITEEERNLLKRIQSMKRDNMRWETMVNALNPTMLLFGGKGNGLGYQMGFQALLASARSIVEYKAMQREQDIDELEAMWKLRVEDLEAINNLRKEAQRIVFQLYEKYHLKENDRLTEETASNFNDIITEPDSKKEARLLEDNYQTYKNNASYYYYRGMAYLDNNDYSKAKTMFDIYLKKYAENPILRYDEKSGCIALAKLVYDKNLSNDEKENLIQMAIRNLPGNSSAILQCAMVYLYEMHMDTKAFQLLRSGIDDENASDKDLLILAVSNLLPQIKKYSSIYNSTIAAINNCRTMDMGVYCNYMLNRTNANLDFLSKAINFSKPGGSDWYFLWLNKRHLDDDLTLYIPKKFDLDINKIHIYVEKHSRKEVHIQQLQINYGDAITENDVQDIACFKANKDLKYLFLDVLVPNQLYKVKPDLDYTKIQDESFPRMSEFTLTDNDKKDIIEFCENNVADKRENLFCTSKVDEKEEELDSLNDARAIFCGDSIYYKPYHSLQQEGYYLRLVFSNGAQLLYKYDSDSNTLKGYMGCSATGNMIFGNKQYEKEYKATKALPVDEPWYMYCWDAMCVTIQWIWKLICWSWHVAVICLTWFKNVFVSFFDWVVKLF